MARLARRGVAQSVEALLLGLATLASVALAIAYFALQLDVLELARPEPASLDAALCGRIVTVVNTGETSVEVYSILYVYIFVDPFTGERVAQTSERLLNAELAPGESLTVTLDMAPNTVFLRTSLSARPMPVEQACGEEVVDLGQPRFGAG